MKAFVQRKNTLRIMRFGYLARLFALTLCPELNGNFNGLNGFLAIIADSHAPD